MKKIFILWLLIMSHAPLFSQSCSVNAGGNLTICGTSATLQATTTGTTNGLPVWSLVSKPAGAPDPVIANVNSYNTNVTGITFPGNYVFSVSQQCVTGTSTSQVTILAPGEVSTFTAGPDITTVSALTGVANLNATIPAGYTASWTYYNLNSFEFNGAVVTTNATMTGTTTATPTLTLTKKADHDIDPVYRAVLRITSTNNPSCWYEDNAIVRFIPNPNVSYPTSRNFCSSQSAVADSRYFYDPNSSSPRFSDNTANASANPAFGTTITMNVISQPAGGNLAYGRMQNGRLFFAPSFNQTPGPYVFTLTITNANGTYTTPNLTFNYNGSQPEALSFLDPAYPEQMELYTSGNSGGAVYCNRAGTTAPITFYFKINPADPATLTSTVTASGIIPAGGAPSIVVNGAGTRNRSATLTPPAGGWRVGTYKFTVSVGNGTCNVSRLYYVHISDGNRPDVEVEDMTVCYPGSGVVSATIPLPEVYKGIISPSYFQDFNGRYELTVLSTPTGSAVPTFEPVEFRTITNTSTVISNLNMQGEYRFRIRAVPPPGGAPGFLQKEYACSGTSLEHEFSIFVSTQVNSNAGSDQSLSCDSTVTLNGNNPGIASSGVWTLVSKPAGAPDPVIVDPTIPNTQVTGLNSLGTYTFRWAVTTGQCISSDEVQVIVDGLCPFTCDSKMYLAQNTNTALYQIVDSTNPFTYPIIGAPAGYQHNAAGLNPVDGYIYAMKTFSNNLLKINANGVITDMGAISGLPAATSTTNYNAGEFDDLGNYYIKHAGANSTIYRVDISNKVATPISITQATDPSDLAYNVTTELLYGVNSGGRLFSVNPSDGFVTLIGSSPGAAVFGGLFGSSTGEIYGINNAGGFYQFNLSDGTRTLISEAPASGNNDGAHCVTAPIAFAADLSVTKTDNTDIYTPGTATIYTIVVRNDGPFGVLNAEVTDNVPAGIPVANVTYTAVASSGSSTTVTGSQSGAINDLVSLPVNGTVTYTVTINIPANFTGSLINTVNVTSPVNSTDPDLSNNQATDTNVFSCTEDPAPGTPDGFTKVGISTMASQTAGWPENIANGWITMESKSQGFVITRVQHVGGGTNGVPAPTDSVTDPREGMIVYDIDDACVKLFNGIIWNCIERSCNTPTTN